MTWPNSPVEREEDRHPEYVHDQREDGQHLEEEEHPRSYRQDVGLVEVVQQVLKQHFKTN